MPRRRLWRTRERERKGPGTYRRVVERSLHDRARIRREHLASRLYDRWARATRWRYVLPQRLLPWIFGLRARVKGLDVPDHEEILEELREKRERIRVARARLRLDGAMVTEEAAHG